MDPANSFQPVTRTIEEFINTRFSIEQYGRLASQMTGYVEDTPLVENFTRKFLAQTGYMYHFAPRAVRENILDGGIKLRNQVQYYHTVKTPGPLSGKNIAWFSPNPTLYPSMIADLFDDDQLSQGIDVFRVKTTPAILSKTFLDPKHRYAGKSSSSIMNSFEASGRSARGLNFLMEYMKGAVGAGVELESIKNLGFDVPIAESLAMVDDAASHEFFRIEPRVAAELFIPGVTSSREFKSAGAKNFEQILAGRIQVDTLKSESMSPADRKLSQRVLAQVREAKSESIRALEAIDATTTTSAKLTPKTFDKIIKSGDVAASVMRFARGL